MQVGESIPQVVRQALTSLLRSRWRMVLYGLFAVVLAACGTAQAALVEVTTTPYVRPTPTILPSATLIPTPAPTSPSDTPTPPRPTPTPSPTATPTPSPTPQPPVGAPTRLRIPAIGVDASVESVGLTADGAMDVPKNYANVAWYNLGPKPGAAGNSVIAGHVDSKTGPAVFWDLRKLRPGDEVFVLGADGIERRFVVTAMQVYKRDAAPLEKIFGAAPGTHLNLITCAGVFDRTRKEYDSNLIVYTDYAP